MIASCLIWFYGFWHGRLHLKGAGALIRFAIPFCSGLHAYQLKLAEGHTITVDFRDVSATYWLNHLLGECFEENGLLTALKALIKPESIIWDVGANCGLFSYLLSNDPQVSKIVFFEPNPLMFHLASSATRVISKIEGHPYAISDKSGYAEMTIPNGMSTTGTLESSTSNRKFKSVSIRCITGDELIRTESVPVPDLIKIDTEGHEQAVIRGLAETIRNHSPIIFFEHISLSDSEVLALTPDDYDLYTVSDTDGSMCHGFDRTIGHNSLLIPRSKSAVLDIC